jgi:small subunit ribosomal protein S9
MAKRDDKNKQDAPKVEVKKSRRKDSVSDLKDIGAASASAEAPKMNALDLSTAQPEAKKREKKIDAKGRAYGTGRRKGAVARVWLQRGSGKVTVNGRDQSIYFARHTQRLILNQPFLIVGSVGHYDIVCTVKGGGLSGQAGAVRHGISRALENFDPQYRPALKKAGMLTRDARIVERKKVGKHGARRTKQWAKR